MRPRFVVVGHVFARHTPQMGRGEDQQLIQTFSPPRSDPALGKGVCIGSANGRVDDVNVLSPKDSIEGCGELGVLSWISKCMGGIRPSSSQTI